MPLNLLTLKSILRAVTLINYRKFTGILKILRDCDVCNISDDNKDNQTLAPAQQSYKLGFKCDFYLSGAPPGYPVEVWKLKY